MLNEMQTASDAGAPVTGAYKVDVSKGGHNGAVSRQWMARPQDQRFESLDALFDFKKKAFEESFTIPTKSSGFELHGLAEITRKEQLHHLMVGFAGSEAGSNVQKVFDVAPTHWSFRQICGLAKAPGGFLADDIPAPIVSDVLNWRLKHTREVAEIKAYTGAEQLYAATGPGYGRVPDFEVVDALRQIAGDGLGSMRWKTPGTLNWSNGTYDPFAIGDKDQRCFYGSDRDTFVFLVDDLHPIEVGKTKDGHPDLMHRGFYIQNSEVGAKTLKLAAFYLRGTCMNRNLWGVEGFEELTIRHTGQALTRWIEQARPALEGFANRSDARLIEGVEKAKAAKVADDDAAAMEFLKNRSFSGAQAKRILEIAEKEEGQKPRTVWDFAQGITAFARDIPNTDARLDVEGVAKQMLDKVA
jgi:hypothetical protein